MKKRGISQGKKAQIQISFGMIFSVILIVAFIAVGIYAIIKFLDWRDCAKIGMFKQDFQEEINKAWNSEEATNVFSGSLPSSIEEVCFVDVSKDGVGEEYEKLKDYGYSPNTNFFLYPLKNARKCKLESFEITHLDIKKITQQENPYCVKNVKGKVEIKIGKSFYESLVKIEKVYAVVENSGGESNGGSNEDGSSGESSRSCETNSDCVKQQVGCCPCNMGGEEKCMSKREEEEAQKKLANCSIPIGCTALYNCQNTSCNCVNGVCQTESTGNVCQSNSDCMEFVCPGSGFVHEVCENNKCVLKTKCVQAGFCGASTLASCNGNSDCKIGGCSSQVCEGNNENTITTCEYKSCFDSTTFGLSCKCVSEKCKWA